MKRSFGRRDIFVGALFSPSIIRTGLLMPVSSRLLSHFPECDLLTCEVDYEGYSEPFTAFNATVNYSIGRKIAYHDVPICKLFECPSQLWMS